MITLECDTKSLRKTKFQSIMMLLNIAIGAVIALIPVYVIVKNNDISLFGSTFFLTALGVVWVIFCYFRLSSLTTEIVFSDDYIEHTTLRKSFRNELKSLKSIKTESSSSSVALSCTFKNAKIFMYLDDESCKTIRDNSQYFTDLGMKI